MFVRCPGCQTTYRLGAERVPSGGLRLRCPGCGNAFRVREPATASEQPRPTPTALPVPTPVAPGIGRPTVLPVPKSPARPTPTTVPTPEATRIPRPASEAGTPVLGLERDDRRPPRAVTRPVPSPGLVPPPPAPWQAERTLDLGAPPPAPPARLETPPFQPGVPSAPPPPAAGDATPGAEQRARRLARALVSDILVYNQERRDRALHEGNWASALGAEVNRAWDVYKSKVDPQVLRSTSYFKDALNEILAGGQRLF